MTPIVLLNCVGMTPRLLAHAPRLRAIGGWCTGMIETLPAVTCTAQATMLTGKTPREHGIVANGWLFKDTMEVRFWQQSNKLIQAEPFYETLKKRNPKFKCAKLFWWFNQGAAVDISVTPKPWYGFNGDKVFDYAGTPPSLVEKLKKELPPFPFSAFWGPMAGIKSTQWIAAMSAKVVRDEKPDLTMVYLPHLDYDPQRFGPAGCDMTKCVKELDDACEPLLDAAKAVGAQVWVISEYGHCNVTTPIMINAALRKAGLLAVRDGPFGEQLDTFNSRAFAVVDHQIAHISVADTHDLDRVKDLITGLNGVATVLSGEARGDLDHPRSGDLVCFSKPDAWFAYPYWLDDTRAPDFARCIAIHNKPGFDPCEMFFDSKRRFPKLHAARKLLRKKLGFRTLFDVCPLDASVVKGSHGLRAADPLDRPLIIGHGEPRNAVAMTDVRDLLLNAIT